MRKFFKYLSYTLLFMVMSIASAYGVITISLDNATKMQNNTNSNQSQPLPEQITSIYENITNADAMQLNLSANVSSTSEVYVIDIEVEMDTSNGFENLALEGSLKIAGNARSAMYNIDFAYQDGMAYFDLFNGRIAVDTTTIIQPLMSILSILNVEVPALGSLDLSTLTPEVIMGMLSNFTEEKNETQINLVIDVPVIGKLNLVCDLDYNVQEFSLPTLSVGDGTSMTLSSKIEYPEFVDITEKIESEYVKVGNLLNVAEVVLDTLSQDNLALDFAIDMEETDIEGKLYVDLQKLSSMAVVDIMGQELKVIAVDNIMYIEFANLFASFALDDFEKINQILKSQFDIDVPLDTITDILSALKDGDLNKLAQSLDIETSPSDIDLSVLEDVIVRGNLTSIKVRDVGDFGVIVDDNGDLKRLAYSGFDVSAVLETCEYKEFALAKNADEYIDIALLLPTVENAISIMKSETLSGEIYISVGAFNIPLTYEISQGEETYGNIYGDILGAQLEINILNNKIFISFADQPMVAIDLNTIKDSLKDFIAELELDIEMGSLAQIIGAIALMFNQENALFTSLEQTVDGFVLSTANGLEIVASNASQEIKLSCDNDDFAIWATIIGSNASVEKATVNETDFAEFENLLYLAKAFVKSGLINFVDGIINYFSDDNFEFDFDVDYNKYSLNGKLKLNLENSSAKLTIDLNGKELNIYVIDNIVYLEHGNIYIQFAINDFAKVETFLYENFGIQLPTQFIADILKCLESDTPLSIIALLGITFNIANLDQTVLDNIVVDDNLATIPVENLGEFKVRVDSEILSNVSFVGNDFSANVDFVEYSDFTLATSENNYVELIKFLPTIENAIDIACSNTISGKIEVEIDGNLVAIDYVVDKTDVNDIYACFETEILGASIKVIYMDGQIYVNCADSIKLMTTVATLPDAIAEFLTAIGIDVNAEELGLAMVSVIVSTIYDQEIPFLITSFVETDNGLEIELFNGIKLSVNNLTKQINLNGSIDLVNASISIIGGELDIVRPTLNDSEYNQVETVLDLVERFINTGLLDIAIASYNYFAQGNIGINFNVDYAGNVISGKLNVNLDNLSMKLSLGYDNFSANIVFIENVVYLELGNIYAKFKIEDISLVETFLADNFGINLPFSEISELYNELQTSDSPLAIIAGFGLSLDLSVIDMNFFDGITVDGNITTIPVENLGEFKVRVDSEVLSNVSFFGNDFSANVDFVEYSDFALATSENNYVELIKFLPTIENAIDIACSNTISGKIEVEIDGNLVAIDYVVDKTDVNDIYACFETEILGASIKVIYMDGQIYVNCADSVKLMTTMATLPDALAEFLTAIDIDVNAEELGLAMVSVIVSTIYDQEIPFLITSFVETDNGLEIELFNGIKLSVNNLTKQINLNGSIDLVNASISIIGGELDIVRPTLNDSEYNQVETVLDLVERFINTGLLDIAIASYNYFAQGNIGINFNVDYAGNVISGKLNVNLDNLSMKLSLGYDNFSANIVFIENVVYLELGNIYAKFKIEDISLVETFLADNFGINLPFSEISELYNEIQTSDSPLAIIAGFGLSLDLSVIDFNFFDGITVDGNITTIPVENIGEFKVRVDSEVLSNVSFVGNDISANVDFVEYSDFTLATSENNYVELIKFLPTIENAIDIAHSNTISGKIEVEIDGNLVEIDYVVDKTDVNDIYAHFETEILGASIKVIYMDGKIYVNCADSVKLMTTVASFPDALAEFLTAIGIDVNAEELGLAMISVIVSTIYDQEIPFLITSFVETDNGLEIELFNGIKLSVNNLTKQINLNGSIDLVNASISIIGGELDIVRPTLNDSEYNQVETVLDLVERFINTGLLDIAIASYNYFAQGNIGINFNVDYTGNVISGKLNVNLDNLSMKLSLGYDNFSANILFIENVVYLELGNIYAKFKMEDISLVETFLADNFGINLPFSEISELYNEIQTSDSPLAIIAGFGLSLDLSVIDFAFFDGITVDGNITTIPVENIGEFKVRVDSEVLSNVSFVGNDFSANVDFVEYSDFALATSENNYVELIKFLPTIENAIDIAHSNTISGKIEVEIDGNLVAIDYVVDKTDVNDIYAYFETEILGASIKVIYMDGQIYVNCADSVKLMTTVATLPDAIAEFLTAINIETDNEETVNDIVDAIENLLYDEATPLLVTGLNEIENGLILQIFNGFNLTILNNEKKLTLDGAYENINAIITIFGGDLIVDRPEIDEEEYDEFQTVLDLTERFINTGLINVAEGAINYFKNGTLGLNFNVNYQNKVLDGSVNFNLADKEIKVCVNYDGLPINVIVLDKTAYLELGNIYLKLAVSDLDKVEKLLRDYFEIDLPLTQIVDMFEETQNSDQPLASISEMGKINLSAIDLSFFDNVSTEGDLTTISTEEFELKITLASKVLSNVDFSGFGLQASANFVEFKDIALTLSDSQYLDLIKFLPTIENAIEIISSNTLTGLVSIDTPSMNEVIDIEFAVNKADLSNVYVELNTQIQGANIKVMYLGNKVYIHFAETIKLIADFETLPSTIKTLLEKADIAFEFSNDIDLDSTLNSILNGLKPSNIPVLITSLIEGQNGFTITLHDNTNITLNNMTKQIDFAVSTETSATGYIIGSDAEISIPTLDASLYTPLEDVLDLVEAFFNMAKLRDFHIAGTFDIVGTIAGIDLKWNVPFDVKIKQVDGEFQMMMTMGAIPVVVGLNNDVPYQVGDTNGGKNRYMTIYVKGNDVYIYRTEEVNLVFGMGTRIYEKCTKITIQAFMADPMRYIQYAIGFSDTIMNAIADSVAKASNREQPINLNNVIKSLTVVNDTSFEIVLNAAELANNSDLDTLTLDIGIAHDAEGNSYLSTLGLEVYMPLADIFKLTLSTNDTRIVDYGKTVDMSALYDYVNNYRYEYEAEWEASDGQWSKANETKYTIIFEENGGPAVADVTAAYGTEFTLPSFKDIVTDDGEKKVVKSFVGWFTTSTFDEGTEFTNNFMPRGGATLYAKWSEKVTYYRTISFVTNSDETAQSITALEGSEVTLPSLSLKTESTETSVTTYSFVGWFLDEACTQEFNDYIMPSTDTVLYAKWEVADIAQAKLFELFDNGVSIYSRYMLAGKPIDLSKVGKVNSETLFYIDANYATKYEGEFVMPENDFALHIRNQYTLTIVSDYYNVTNSTTKVWQGSALSIPSQQTVVDDDYKTRQITYAFNGYKVNGELKTVPSVMPNSDLSLVADWTVTTKKYYTVSFDTRWVKPSEWLDNDSKWTGKITCKTAAGSIAPLLLLEGTTVTPSNYSTTAKYSYQAMLISADYNFKILTWNTEGCQNISNGASNDSYTTMQPFAVSGNITLFATWGVY